MADQKPITAEECRKEIERARKLASRYGDRPVADLHVDPETAARIITARVLLALAGAWEEVSDKVGPQHDKVGYMDCYHIAARHGLPVDSASLNANGETQSRECLADETRASCPKCGWDLPDHSPQCPLYRSPCPVCGGVPMARGYLCPECGGSGRIRPPISEHVTMADSVPCPTCQGER